MAKKNAYKCDNGHVTITIDNEEFGTSNFNIDCPKCNLLAVIDMKFSDTKLKATHEWYKPATYEGLSSLEIEHIKHGGLLLRKIKIEQV